MHIVLAWVSSILPEGHNDDAPKKTIIELVNNADDELSGDKNSIIHAWVEITEQVIHSNGQYNEMWDVVDVIQYCVTQTGMIPTKALQEYGPDDADSKDDKLAGVFSL